MPGTLVANPHTYKPWVAGDIVYLKPWSEQTRVAYEEAGVQEKAADHPAVVLFRSDPRSKYVVVAIVSDSGRYSASCYQALSANIPR